MRVCYADSPEDLSGQIRAADASIRADSKPLNREGGNRSGEL